MASWRALLLVHSRFSRHFPSPSPFFFSSKPDFASENPILPNLDPTAYNSPSDDAPIRIPKIDASNCKSIGDSSTDISPDSTAELKKMIGKYMAGDTEILPSIFEEILLRKLSGEHEDSDNELMEEIRSRVSCTSEFVEKGEEGEGEEPDEEEESDFTSDEESEFARDEVSFTSDYDSDSSE